MTTYLEKQLDFYDEMPLTLIENAAALTEWLDTKPPRRATFHAANLAMINGKLDVLDTIMQHQGRVRVSHLINEWAAERWPQKAWIQAHKIPMISFDMDDYLDFYKKYTPILDAPLEENIEAHIEANEQMSSIMNLLYSNFQYNGKGERVMYFFSDAEPESAAELIPEGMSILKQIGVGAPGNV